MDGQQPARQKARYFPWVRVIVAVLISLLIAGATLLAILSTGHVIAGYWIAIIPLIFSAIGLLIPLGQWLFPISPDIKDSPLPPPEHSPVIPTDQTTSPKTLWNVPYRRNPYFTGREDVLQLLHERLSIAKTAAITQSQAINGLGGVGKTQVAVEYAYRHREEYRGVLWVNAATRDTIIASFLDLAMLLALSQQQEADQNKVIAAVLRWFTEHDHWLLIFDNADDLTLAEEFLPTSDTGSLLLTTRNQAPGTLAESLTLDTMHQDEGMLLVLRRAKLLASDATLVQARAEDRTQAAHIVGAMVGLPLALDQAAAYIEETGCTLAAFLEHYQRQSSAILRRRGGTGKEHPLPVATTWSLAFAQVQQGNPAAADLLRVCSFLAPDVIPEELIREGAIELGPLLATWQKGSMQLDEGIGTLTRFSLVRRHREERTLSLHRLVQAVQLLDMDEAARKLWAERAVRAINHVFPLAEVSTWPQCERLLPHAIRCRELIENYKFVFPEATRLLDGVAYYLVVRAQYPEAEPLYQHALTIREQTLRPNHPDIATSFDHLARLYYTQGKYKEAEPLYQHALAIKEQALGPNHPEMATSFDDLAKLYYAQGKYKEAEPLYQRALAIQERVLGPQHAWTATTLGNLATLYFNQGKYIEAESLWKRALATEERMLGKDHRNTALTLYSLAVLYNTQGKYKEAEPLYQRALAIQERVLGPQHPDTAHSLHGLASLYSNQGKYKEAEPLYRRSLDIMEKALGPEHRKTKTVQVNYTLLLEVMKREKQ